MCRLWLRSNSVVVEEVEVVAVELVGVVELVVVVVVVEVEVVVVVVVMEALAVRWVPLVSPPAQLGRALSRQAKGPGTLVQPQGPSPSLGTPPHLWYQPPVLAAAVVVAAVAVVVVVLVAVVAVAAVVVGVGVGVANPVVGPALAPALARAPDPGRCPPSKSGSGSERCCCPCSGLRT